MKGLKADQPFISYTIFKTPIGWCGLVKTKKGLMRIFIGYSTRHQLIKHIKKIFGNTITKVSPTEKLIDTIIRFSSGENIPFYRYKMDWSSLTPFECAVLNETMKIPYGTVTTYGSLAQKIGFPRGSRAVGNALSRQRSMR